MLATIEARAVMYAGQMAEGRTWAVKDAAEEKAAITLLWNWLAMGNSTCVQRLTIT